MYVIFSIVIFQVQTSKSTSLEAEVNSLSNSLQEKVSNLVPICVLIYSCDLYMYVLSPVYLYMYQHTCV
jgi:hypothetical protein